MKRKAAVITAVCMCALVFAVVKNYSEGSSLSEDSSSDSVNDSIVTESKKEYSVGELMKIQNLLLKHSEELHLLKIGVSESKDKLAIEVENGYVDKLYILTDGLHIDREVLEVTSSDDGGATMV